MSRTPAEVRHCSDCGSDHIGIVPCGMTWLQRMRSTRLDGSVTATRTKHRYFDDQPLQDVFGGLTADERKEQMMDDTKGHGFIEDPKDFTPQVAKDLGFAD